MSLILLINPKVGKDRCPCPEDRAAREPLAILALGSYVKTAEIEVRLLDAVLYEEEYIRRIISDLIREGPRPILIGYSVMTAQISHALELSDFVKSLDRTIPIIWGGVHPTLFPKETSLDDSVDIVVHGRGELPLFEICKQLTAKGEISNHIPGTAIKGRFNQSEKLFKMTGYPYFDYELLDLKRYLGPLPHYLLSENEKPNRALQVLSARGCPWRCGFCINVATRNPWTPLSSERYLDELSANIKKFKLDAYRVMDEDFFVSKKRSFEIVEGLIKRGITLTWAANVRANYFRDDYLSVDFARRLRSTGCKFFTMGAESGNQRVLDLIKKDITVEQITHSAEVCSKADIIPIYSWMIGIPTQTKEEIFDTIEVMLEISRICPSAVHYPFWIFRPFPGGSLYNLCIENSLRAPKALRGWPEMGADDNTNTGFYNPVNFPWIKDVKFIEYFGENAHRIPKILSKSLNLRTRVKARLIYLIIKNWDNILARAALLSFKKLTTRILRMIRLLLGSQI